ncbi:MAG: hypothetical protein IID36_02110 [Planctomycetes bacterium]|nr:hypothetical protein [Planctomycetota bacterium]
MRTYVRWLVATVLYVTAAQFAFVAFVQNPGNPQTFEKARLPDMVDGTAHRPFVYRTLLPTTVRLIEAAMPDAWHARLTEFIPKWGPAKTLFSSTRAEEEQAPVTYLISYALSFAALIGFAVVLRAAIAHFYSPPSLVSDALPAAALAFLPVMYCYVSYPYDLPQLFFFSLGLLLLAQRRWWAFYPIFLLGMFSKETTALLVMIHVFGHVGRMPNRTLIAHASGQLAVVVVVRALLQFVLFADNPGAPFEFWLARNWAIITDSGQWCDLFLNFVWVGRSSLVLPTGFNVLYLLIVPLVFYRWSAKPQLLRRAIWIAPLLVVLAFFLGYVDEVRAFYEPYIVIFLLASGTACDVANVPARATPPMQSDEPSDG